MRDLVCGSIDAAPDVGSSLAALVAWAVGVLISSGAHGAGVVIGPFCIEGVELSRHEDQRTYEAKLDRYLSLPIPRGRKQYGSGPNRHFRRLAPEDAGPL